ncbi:hypothetical protein PQO03_14915 [Lentisphaera profundi]|uniref:Uncharacterized protein n=1 Tax=Lentisphaera profundi TaxID=1658616 RepID=A0ABY7VY06_9BACT|nr:hypothetical protein [Lentisphaera profundi]WDE99125.1 hypothetical protein PQO03_14915 [Lentisphaera profundi]
MASGKYTLDSITNVDAVEEGFDSAKVTVNVDNYDGEITGTPGNDSLTVNGNKFEGTVDLSGGNNKVSIKGNDSDFSIAAGEGNDKLDIKGIETEVSGDLGGGSNSVSVSGENVDLDLVTGAGSDKLTLKGSGASGDINLGDGNNSVSVKGSIADVEITTGSGADKIDVKGGFFDGVINAGAGADNISIKGTNFTGSLDAGAGADTIAIKGTNFTGSVDGGADADTISVKSKVFNGDITGGSGNDTILVSSKANGSNASIDGGEGNDTILVKSKSSSIEIDGGSGDNTITIKGKDFTGDITTSGSNDTVDITGKGFDGKVIGDGANDTVNIDKSTVSTIRLENIEQVNLNFVKKALIGNFELTNTKITGTDNTDIINLVNSSGATLDLGEGADEVEATGQVGDLTLINVEDLSINDVDGLDGAVIDIVGSNVGTIFMNDGVDHVFTLTGDAEIVDLGNGNSTITINGVDDGAGGLVFNGTIVGTGSNSLVVADNVDISGATFTNFDSYALGANVTNNIVIDADDDFSAGVGTAFTIKDGYNGVLNDTESVIIDDDATVTLISNSLGTVSTGGNSNVTIIGTAALDTIFEGLGTLTIGGEFDHTITDANGDITTLTLAKDVTLTANDLVALEEVNGSGLGSESLTLVNHSANINVSDLETLSVDNVASVINDDESLVNLSVGSGVNAVVNDASNIVSLTGKAGTAESVTINGNGSAEITTVELDTLTITESATINNDTALDVINGDSAGAGEALTLVNAFDGELVKFSTVTVNGASNNLDLTDVIDLVVVTAAVITSDSNLATVTGDGTSDITFTDTFTGDVTQVDVLTLQGANSDIDTDASLATLNLVSGTSTITGATSLSSVVSTGLSDLVLDGATASAISLENIETVTLVDDVTITAGSELTSVIGDGTTVVTFSNAYAGALTGVEKVIGTGESLTLTSAYTGELENISNLIVADSADISADTDLTTVTGNGSTDLILRNNFEGSLVDVENLELGGLNNVVTPDSTLLTVELLTANANLELVDASSVTTVTANAGAADAGQTALELSGAVADQPAALEIENIDTINFIADLEITEIGSDLDVINGNGVATLALNSDFTGEINNVVVLDLNETNYDVSADFRLTTLNLEAVTNAKLTDAIALESVTGGASLELAGSQVDELTTTGLVSLTVADDIELDSTGLTSVTGDDTEVLLLNTFSGDANNLDILELEGVGNVVATTDVANVEFTEDVVITDVNDDIDTIEGDGIAELTLMENFTGIITKVNDVTLNGDSNTFNTDSLLVDLDLGATSSATITGASSLTTVDGGVELSLTGGQTSSLTTTVLQTLNVVDDIVITNDSNLDTVNGNGVAQVTLNNTFEGDVSSLTLVNLKGLTNIIDTTSVSKLTLDNQAEITADATLVEIDGDNDAVVVLANTFAGDITGVAQLTLDDNNEGAGTDNDVNTDSSLTILNLKGAVNSTVSNAQNLATVNADAGAVESLVLDGVQTGNLATFNLGTITVGEDISITADGVLAEVIGAGGNEEVTLQNAFTGSADNLTLLDLNGGSGIGPVTTTAVLAVDVNGTATVSADPALINVSGDGTSDVLTLTTEFNGTATDLTTLILELGGDLTTNGVDHVLTAADATIDNTNLNTVSGDTLNGLAETVTLSREFSGSANTLAQLNLDGGSSATVDLTSVVSVDVTGPATLNDIDGELTTLTGDDHVTLTNTFNSGDLIVPATATGVTELTLESSNNVFDSGVSLEALNLTLSNATADITGATELTRISAVDGGNEVVTLSGANNQTIQTIDLNTLNVDNNVTVNNDGELTALNGDSTIVNAQTTSAQFINNFAGSAKAITTLTLNGVGNDVESDELLDNLNVTALGGTTDLDGASDLLTITAAAGNETVNLTNIASFVNTVTTSALETLTTNADLTLANDTVLSSVTGTGGETVTLNNEFSGVALSLATLDLNGGSTGGVSTTDVVAVDVNGSATISDQNDTLVTLSGDPDLNDTITVTAEFSGAATNLAQLNLDDGSDTGVTANGVVSVDVTGTATITANAVLVTVTGDDHVTLTNDFDTAGSSATGLIDLTLGGSTNVFASDVNLDNLVLTTATASATLTGATDLIKITAVDGTSETVTLTGANNQTIQTVDLNTLNVNSAVVVNNDDELTNLNGTLATAGSAQLTQNFTGNVTNVTALTLDGASNAVTSDANLTNLITTAISGTTSLADAVNLVSIVAAGGSETVNLTGTNASPDVISTVALEVLTTDTDITLSNDTSLNNVSGTAGTETVILNGEFSGDASSLAMLDLNDGSSTGVDTTSVLAVDVNVSATITDTNDTLTALSGDGDDTITVTADFNGTATQLAQLNLNAGSSVGVAATGVDAVSVNGTATIDADTDLVTVTGDGNDVVILESVFDGSVTGINNLTLSEANNDVDTDVSLTNLTLNSSATATVSDAQNLAIVNGNADLAVESLVLDGLQTVNLQTNNLNTLTVNETITVTNDTVLASVIGNGGNDTITLLGEFTGTANTFALLDLNAGSAGTVTTTAVVAVDVNGTAIVTDTDTSLTTVSGDGTADVLTLTAQFNGNASDLTTLNLNTGGTVTSTDVVNVVTDADAQLTSTGLVTLDGVTGDENVVLVNTFTGTATNLDLLTVQSGGTFTATGVDDILTNADATITNTGLVTVTGTGTENVVLVNAFTGTATLLDLLTVEAGGTFTSTNVDDIYTHADATITNSGLSTITGDAGTENVVLENVFNGTATDLDLLTVEAGGTFTSTDVDDIITDADATITNTNLLTVTGVDGAENVTLVNAFSGVATDLDLLTVQLGGTFTSTDVDDIITDADATITNTNLDTITGVDGAENVTLVNAFSGVATDLDLLTVEDGGTFTSTDVDDIITDADATITNTNLDTITGVDGAENVTLVNAFSGVATDLDLLTVQLGGTFTSTDVDDIITDADATITNTNLDTITGVDGAENVTLVNAFTGTATDLDLLTVQSGGTFTATGVDDILTNADATITNTGLVTVTGTGTENVVLVNAFTGTATLLDLLTVEDGGTFTSTDVDDIITDADATITNTNLDTITGVDGAENVTLVNAFSGVATDLDLLTVQLGGTFTSTDVDDIITDADATITNTNLDTITGVDGAENVTLVNAFSGVATDLDLLTVQLGGTFTSTDVDDIITDADATITNTNLDTITGVDGAENVTLVNAFSGVATDLDLLTVQLGGTFTSTDVDDIITDADATITNTNLDTITGVDGAENVTLVNAFSGVATDLDLLTVQLGGTFTSTDVDDIITDADATITNTNLDTITGVDGAENVTLVNAFSGVATDLDLLTVQLGGTFTSTDVDDIITDADATITNTNLDTITGVDGAENVTLVNAFSGVATDLDLLTVQLGGTFTSTDVDDIITDADATITNTNLDTITGVDGAENVTLVNAFSGVATDLDLLTVQLGGTFTSTDVDDIITDADATITNTNLDTITGVDGAENVTLVNAFSGVATDLDLLTVQLGGTFTSTDVDDIITDADATITNTNLDTITGVDGAENVTLFNAFTGTASDLNLLTVEAGGNFISTDVITINTQADATIDNTGLSLIDGTDTETVTLSKTFNGTATDLFALKLGGTGHTVLADNKLDELTLLSDDATAQLTGATDLIKITGSATLISSETVTLVGSNNQTIQTVELETLIVDSAVVVNNDSELTLLDGADTVATLTQSFSGTVADITTLTLDGTANLVAADGDLVALELTADNASATVSLASSLALITGTDSAMTTETVTLTSAPAALLQTVDLEALNVASDVHVNNDASLININAGGFDVQLDNNFNGTIINAVDLDLDGSTNTVISDGGLVNLFVLTDSTTTLTDATNALLEITGDAVGTTTSVDLQGAPHTTALKTVNINSLEVDTDITVDADIRLTSVDGDAANTDLDLTIANSFTGSATNVDTLTLAGETNDLTSDADLDTLNLTFATGSTSTVNSASSLTLVNGGAGTDTLTLGDGSDVATLTINGIETLNLGEAGVAGIEFLNIAGAGVINLNLNEGVTVGNFTASAALLDLNLADNAVIQLTDASTLATLDVDANITGAVVTEAGSTNFTAITIGTTGAVDANDISSVTVHNADAVALIIGAAGNETVTLTTNSAAITTVALETLNIDTDTEITDVDGLLTTLNGNISDPLDDDNAVVFMNNFTGDVSGIDVITVQDNAISSFTDIDESLLTLNVGESGRVTVSGAENLATVVGNGSTTADEVVTINDRTNTAAVNFTDIEDIRLGENVDLVATVDDELEQVTMEAGANVNLTLDATVVTSGLESVAGDTDGEESLTISSADPLVTTSANLLVDELEIVTIGENMNVTLGDSAGSDVDNITIGKDSTLTLSNVVNTETYNGLIVKGDELGGGTETFVLNTSGDIQLDFVEQLETGPNAIVDVETDANLIGLTIGTNSEVNLNDATELQTATADATGNEVLTLQKGISNITNDQVVTITGVDDLTLGDDSVQVFDDVQVDDDMENLTLAEQTTAIVTISDNVDAGTTAGLTNLTLADGVDLTLEVLADANVTITNLDVLTEDSVTVTDKGEITAATGIFETATLGLDSTLVFNADYDAINADFGIHTITGAATGAGTGETVTLTGMGNDLEELDLNDIENLTIDGDAAIITNSSGETLSSLTDATATVNSVTLEFDTTRDLTINNIETVNIADNATIPVNGHSLSLIDGTSSIATLNIDLNGDVTLAGATELTTVLGTNGNNETLTLLDSVDAGGASITDIETLTVNGAGNVITTDNELTTLTLGTAAVADLTGADQLITVSGQALTDETLTLQTATSTITNLNNIEDLTLGDGSTQTFVITSTDDELTDLTLAADTSLTYTTTDDVLIDESTPTQFEAIFNVDAAAGAALTITTGINAQLSINSLTELSLADASYSEVTDETQTLVDLTVGVNSTAKIINADNLDVVAAGGGNETLILDYANDTVDHEMEINLVDNLEIGAEIEMFIDDSRNNALLNLTVGENSTVTFADLDMVSDNDDGAGGNDLVSLTGSTGYETVNLANPITAASSTDIDEITTNGDSSFTSADGLTQLNVSSGTTTVDSASDLITVYLADGAAVDLADTPNVTTIIGDAVDVDLTNGVTYDGTVVLNDGPEESVTLRDTAINITTIENIDVLTVGDGSASQQFVLTGVDDDLTNVFINEGATLDIDGNLDLQYVKGEGSTFETLTIDSVADLASDEIDVTVNGITHNFIESTHFLSGADENETAQNLAAAIDAAFASSVTVVTGDTITLTDLNSNFVVTTDNGSSAVSIGTEVIAADTGDGESLIVRDADADGFKIIDIENLTLGDDTNQDFNTITVADDQLKTITLEDATTATVDFDAASTLTSITLADASNLTLTGADHGLTELDVDFVIAEGDTGSATLTETDVDTLTTVNISENITLTLNDASAVTEINGVVDNPTFIMTTNEEGVIIANGNAITNINNLENVTITDTSVTTLEDNGSLHTLTGSGVTQDIIVNGNSTQFVSSENVETLTIENSVGAMGAGFNANDHVETLTVGDTAQEETFYLDSIVGLESILGTTNTENVYLLDADHGNIDIVDIELLSLSAAVIVTDDDLLDGLLVADNDGLGDVTDLIVVDGTTEIRNADSLENITGSGAASTVEVNNVTTTGAAVGSSLDSVTNVGQLVLNYEGVFAESFTFDETLTTLTFGNDSGIQDWEMTFVPTVMGELAQLESINGVGAINSLTINGNAIEFDITNIADLTVDTDATINDDDGTLASGDGTGDIVDLTVGAGTYTINNADSLVTLDGDNTSTVTVNGNSTLFDTVTSVFDLTIQNTTATPLTVDGDLEVLTVGNNLAGVPGEQTFTVDGAENVTSLTGTVDGTETVVLDDTLASVLNVSEIEHLTIEDDLTINELTPDIATTADGLTTLTVGNTGRDTTVIANDVADLASLTGVTSLFDDIVDINGNTAAFTTVTEIEVLSVDTSTDFSADSSLTTLTVGDGVTDSQSWDVTSATDSLTTVNGSAAADETLELTSNASTLAATDIETLKVGTAAYSTLTIDSFNVYPAAVLTFEVDGVTYTITEGPDWADSAVSADAVATSIAAAIDAEYAAPITTVDGDVIRLDIPNAVFTSGLANMTEFDGGGQVTDLSTNSALKTLIISEDETVDLVSGGNSITTVNGDVGTETVNFEDGNNSAIDINGVENAGLSDDTTLTDDGSLVEVYGIAGGIAGTNVNAVSILGNDDTLDSVSDVINLSVENTADFTDATSEIQILTLGADDITSDFTVTQLGTLEQLNGAVDADPTLTNQTVTIEGNTGLFADVSEVEVLSVENATTLTDTDDLVELTLGNAIATQSFEINDVAALESLSGAADANVSQINFFDLGDAPGDAPQLTHADFGAVTLTEGIDWNVAGTLADTAIDFAAAVNNAFGEGSATAAGSLVSLNPSITIGVDATFGPYGYSTNINVLSSGVETVDINGNSSEFANVTAIEYLSVENATDLTDTNDLITLTVGDGGSTQEFSVDAVSELTMVTGTAGNETLTITGNDTSLISATEIETLSIENTNNVAFATDGDLTSLTVGNDANFQVFNVANASGLTDLAGTAGGTETVLITDNAEAELDVYEVEDLTIENAVIINDDDTADVMTAADGIGDIATLTVGDSTSVQSFTINNADSLVTLEGTVGGTETVIVDNVDTDLLDPDTDTLVLATVTEVENLIVTKSRDFTFDDSLESLVVGDGVTDSQSWTVTNVDVTDNLTSVEGSAADLETLTVSGHGDLTTEKLETLNLDTDAALDLNDTALTTLGVSGSGTEIVVTDGASITTINDEDGQTGQSVEFVNENTASNLDVNGLEILSLVTGTTVDGDGTLDDVDVTTAGQNLTINGGSGLNNVNFTGIGNSLSLTTSNTNSISFDNLQTLTLGTDTAVLEYFYHMYDDTSTITQVNLLGTTNGVETYLFNFNNLSDINGSDAGNDMVYLWGGVSTAIDISDLETLYTQSATTIDDETDSLSTLHNISFTGLVTVNSSGASTLTSILGNSGTTSVTLANDNADTISVTNIFELTINNGIQTTINTNSVLDIINFDADLNNDVDTVLDGLTITGATGLSDINGTANEILTLTSSIGTAVDMSNIADLTVGSDIATGITLADVTDSTNTIADLTILGNAGTSSVTIDAAASILETIVADADVDDTVILTTSSAATIGVTDLDHLTVVDTTLINDDGELNSLEVTAASTTITVDSGVNPSTLASITGNDTTLIFLGDHLNPTDTITLDGVSEVTLLEDATINDNDTLETITLAASTVVTVNNADLLTTINGQIGTTEEITITGNHEPVTLDPVTTQIDLNNMEIVSVDISTRLVDTTNTITTVNLTGSGAEDFDISGASKITVLDGTDNQTVTLETATDAVLTVTDIATLELTDAGETYSQINADGDLTTLLIGTGVTASVDATASLTMTGLTLDDGADLTLSGITTAFGAFTETDAAETVILDDVDDVITEVVVGQGSNMTLETSTAVESITGDNAVGNEVTVFGTQEGLVSEAIIIDDVETVNLTGRLEETFGANLEVNNSAGGGNGVQTINLSDDSNGDFAVIDASSTDVDFSINMNDGNDKIIIDLVAFQGTANGGDGTDEIQIIGQVDAAFALADFETIKLGNGNGSGGAGDERVDLTGDAISHSSATPITIDLEGSASSTFDASFGFWGGLGTDMLINGSVTIDLEDGGAWNGANTIYTFA